MRKKSKQIEPLCVLYIYIIYNIIVYDILCDIFHTLCCIASVPAAEISMGQPQNDILSSTVSSLVAASGGIFMT